MFERQTRAGTVLNNKIYLLQEAIPQDWGGDFYLMHKTSTKNQEK